MCDERKQQRADALKRIANTLQLPFAGRVLHAVHQANQLGQMSVQSPGRVSREWVEVECDANRAVYAES